VINGQMVADATLIGLVNGSIYALISIGIALIFGVVGVVNFAHAEMFMIAAYVAVFLTSYVSGNPLLALAVAVGVVGLLGFLSDSIVLRQVRKTYGHSLRERELASLVATMGLSFLLANAVFLIAGPDYLRVPRLIRGSTRGFLVGIPNQLILASIISITIIAALFASLRFTKIGRAIRAVKDQPNIVEAFGINREFMFSLSFGVASAMAGLAGILLAPIQYVYPYMGHDYLIKAFVITVLAGLGSINGVLVASLLLGVLESIGTSFIGSHAGNLIFFSTMVICLIWRPYGLFGRPEIAK
jgi:branched-chain amino acid transport system permease protein